MAVFVEERIPTQLPVDLIENGTLAEALSVVWVHILEEQVFGDNLSSVQRLKHSENIRIFL